jgi:uncharacterized membrane protein
MIILLALLIGVIAGLRAMMAPAIVSWAAQRGWIDVSATWFAFLAYRWTPWVFTIAAVAELVTDQLPSTPSRKVPPQFGARVVMGGLSGAAIAAHSGAWIAGLIVGALGAVIGTFGGAAARTTMAKSFKSDRPAALIEDAVAIIGALAIVSAVG